MKKPPVEDIILYLGTGDYVLFIMIILGILSLLHYLFDFYGDNAGGLVFFIFISVVVPITLYINYIPYGIYQAKIVEIDNKIIGDNTPASEPFTLNIDERYVKKDKGKVVPLCKEKSNFYIAAFCSKHSYFTITMMGTVREKSLGWEFVDKEKTSIDYKIKVDY